MRFVAVKSQTQQTQAMAYRSRDMLVRQRTQLINALRGHLTEFGVVGPQGITQIKKLAAAIDAPETELPELVRQLAHDHLDIIEGLTARDHRDLRPLVSEKFLTLQSTLTTLIGNFIVSMPFA